MDFSVIFLNEGRCKFHTAVIGAAFATVTANDVMKTHDTDRTFTQNYCFDGRARATLKQPKSIEPAAHHFIVVF
jgi:hypothetical protein